MAMPAQGLPTGSSRSCAPCCKESLDHVGEGWKSSGTSTAPPGVPSPHSPDQPSTHLGLIRHLIGRGVLLHDIWSQDLEAPSKLGEEQAIHIPWGQTDIAGAVPDRGACGLYRNDGKGTGGRGYCKGWRILSTEKGIGSGGTRGAALSREKLLQRGQGGESGEAAEMCGGGQTLCQCLGSCRTCPWASCMGPSAPGMD